MLTSMTGFGRGASDAHWGRLVAEIQSVNRKYLEIFVSMPKEFSRFELEVRKWIGEVISRGQITVRIHLIPTVGAARGLLPDVAILREFKFGWEKISLDLGFDPKAIDLSFILQRLPVLQNQEEAEEKDLPSLRTCIGEALQLLLQMKAKEGKALAKDILLRLQEIEKKVVSIEKLSPDAAAKMRQKLVEKMAEVLKPSVETDDRLFREIALYAEKVDITEEITRLKSHFSQFHEMLTPKESSSGRKMDFLIQEMGREINTIGSKSMDAKIAHLVVEIKGELEKIREQIQNIE